MRTLVPAGHKRREVSRIEGISDAVFAFAITLLVVSLEVPKGFDELLSVMRAFPAFAISFALLFQIWWRQYRFFRSYDVEDGVVVVLTGILLFVVLFYVYPLKFMWSMTMSQLQPGSPRILQSGQQPLLMEIYGLGVIAVFVLLALLYGHAYRLRTQLGLSSLEIIDTRVEIARNLGIATWALLSVAIAFFGGTRYAALSGFVYFGIGFSEGALRRYRLRHHRRLSLA